MLECGSTGICVTTARTCYWKVRPGSALAQRWADDAGTHEILFVADDYEIEDGETLLVEDGELWRE